MAMTAAEPRHDTPALGFDQTAEIALHCDRPMAAQMAMTRLGLVPGSLDAAGDTPALWTTVWSASDGDGRWHAAAAGSDPRPERICRAEPAVLLLDDTAPAAGVEMPDIAVNLRQATLATRDDIETAVRALPGTASSAVAVTDWAVPDEIGRRVARMHAQAVQEAVSPPLPDRHHTQDLYETGRQINGEPLPAGDWCNTCGTPLVESIAVAHGQCAHCFGIDCLREDSQPGEVWQHATDTALRMAGRNGPHAGDVDEPAEAVAL